MHLNSYLLGISNEELRNTVQTTASDIFDKIKHSKEKHLSGLLLGNVQSGKTAQMLGVATKLADEGYNFFVLLTTDSVDLQTQTISRVFSSLRTMEVIGENDELRFKQHQNDKPLILVLKKNTNILKKWRNNIAESKQLDASPIVIIDDEADAASLNTLVNKSQYSTINKHLTSIKKLASASVYVQVTATPQAILLQSEASNFKPHFVTYFKPGLNYLGGDFVYAKSGSYCIKFTSEDELEKNKSDDLPCTEDLTKSLISYLVVCAHFCQHDKPVCNFLIHPSVRIADHEHFARQIGTCLNVLLEGMREDGNSFENEVKLAWDDLALTKPDITNFEDVLDNVSKILDNTSLNIITLNSTSVRDSDLNKGFNIIIGGNSLGRGITIPALQTIYYCRKSKTPQADTFWQHCRMFGYDRIPGLLRVFIPPSLHKLFCDINEANTILINQIKTSGLDGVQIILTSRISPTRKNVVFFDSLAVVKGGVNYFPDFPNDTSTLALDYILSKYDEKVESHAVTPDALLEILKNISQCDRDDWDVQKFINCLNGIKNKRPSTKYTLIIRKNRSISKGTGTLLAPNDRKLSDSFKDGVTLTMYRVSGDRDKGWNGHDLWIPNIRFPDNVWYYDLK